MLLCLTVSIGVDFAEGFTAERPIAVSNLDKIIYGLEPLADPLIETMMDNETELNWIIRKELFT